MDVGNSTALRGSGVKRTKTFTGCWTCRSRRVKCDTARPSCNRCLKSKLSCAGYQVRLVWDGDNSTDGFGWRGANGRGRLLSAESTMQNPVFDMVHIDSILEFLDSWDASRDHEAIRPPYTVFDSVLRRVPAELEAGPLNSDSVTSNGEDNTILECHTALSDINRFLQSESDTNYTIGLTLQQRLLPLRRQYLSSSSTVERRLMHFWATSGSRLMSSTDHPDNPFRSVVIPLAMNAGSEHKLAGHVALLQIIYSISAFNLAQLTTPGEEYQVIAMSHLGISLQYLRQSLTEKPDGQYEAILATIIIMFILDILKAQSSQWRAHLRGARQWLNKLGAGFWKKSQGSHILYQIFQCHEVVGYSQYHNFPGHSEPANLKSLEEEEDGHFDELFLNTNDSQENAYCLDRFLGITQGVLKAMVDINRLGRPGYNATEQELSGLRDRIILANPATLRFSCGTETLEKLARHHACAFYYACMMFYERTLLHTPPRNLQLLAEQSIYHLEAFDILANSINIVGNFWPLFVTACEAQGEVLRCRYLNVLRGTERNGIRANAPLEEVIIEVWRRRDLGDPNIDICWQEVMSDMGIDILLA